MVGVWIDADRNTLCVFSWKQNCILGTRLQFDSMASPALRSCFCCLSSEGEVSIDLQADARHCWLREYHMQAGRLRKSSCENAEAAARVAIGGNSVSLSAQQQDHFSTDVYSRAGVYIHFADASDICWPATRLAAR